MWTRNYKNIISTLLFCENRGYNGTSSNAYGDAYAFNFKAPDGVVREICTANDYTNYSSLVTSAVISRNIGNVNSFAHLVRLLTAQAQQSTGQVGRTIYVGFGNSANAESMEDYALGSMLDTLSLNTGTGTVTLNNNGTLTVDYRVLVTASADCTIQEIGLYMPVYYYSCPNSASPYYYALINRIVLDEPVSIAAGEVGNVTFSITTPEINFN